MVIQGILRDIAPEEREWIIKEYKMCLLLGVEDIWYSKTSETKPGCARLECKGEHIQWLHIILKAKCIILPGKVGPVKDRVMNVVTGGEEWRMPDELWLNMETDSMGRHSMSKWHLLARMNKQRR